MGQGPGWNDEININTISYENCYIYNMLQYYIMTVPRGLYLRTFDATPSDLCFLIIYMNYEN